MILWAGSQVFNDWHWIEGDHVYSGSTFGGKLSFV